MSKRAERLAEYETHPMYGKLLKRLQKYEILYIREFIAANESLDKNAFAFKVNRIGIDQPKTRNAAIVCDILLGVNSSLH